jgi:hypothetical protein
MTARDADNSKAGINRRAKHAGDTLRAEAELLAQEVGIEMAICGLMGVAYDMARQRGVPKDQFVLMLTELLYAAVQGKPLKPR